MRKLILILLFLVFTVAAIGFISFSSFAMATNIKMVNSETDAETVVECAGVIASTNKESMTIISNPLAGIPALSNFAQIVIVHMPAEGETPAAGYLIILSKDLAVQTQVADTHISGSSVFMWLFTLILIILLPKKMGKRKVRRIAEDVVDDEMGSRRAPRRSYRRDDDDYDD